MKVDYAKLLSRSPVEPDEGALAQSIQGRRVLVTGAGGSIGSELCRQIWRRAPARLVMVDRAEDNLFRIHHELRRAEALIGDVCDRTRVEQIFARHRPDVVLHAAAYKHVPMMESNASEAVRNNVLGTRVVADASSGFGAERFVLVSTDKAVQPSSVMGATKRVAELYVRAMDDYSRGTAFMTVRFGNVLGSTGSVVPIFLEQIERGGPVTVTHPEMTRYFMTIPEACGLVLQAAAMGAGGEVFVLDMGEPIKVSELARRLMVLVGKQVAVSYVGARPGEKLVEELAREGLSRTYSSGILVGHPPDVRYWDALAVIDEVLSAKDVRQKLLEVKW